MKQIKVSNLPANPGYGVCLYCDHCGSTYSATAGDYFTYRADHILRCSHGTRRIGRPLRLVQKTTVFKDVL